MLRELTLLLLAFAAMGSITALAAYVADALDGTYTADELDRR